MQSQDLSESCHVKMKVLWYTNFIQVEIYFSIKPIFLSSLKQSSKQSLAAKYINSWKRSACPNREGEVQLPLSKYSNKLYKKQTYCNGALSSIPWA